MATPLRIRGELVGSSFAVGILPNGQHAYTLTLHSFDESLIPEHLIKARSILPPLSPQPLQPSRLLELMPLNRVAHQKQLRRFGPYQSEPLPRHVGHSITHLIFPFRANSRVALGHFLRQHFCQHVVVADGFGVEHRVDYSPNLMPQGAERWHLMDGGTTSLAPRGLSKSRDRYGLALLVRALALSPFDAAFNLEQPYLYHDHNEWRVRTERYYTAPTTQSSEHTEQFESPEHFEHTKCAERTISGTRPVFHSCLLRANLLRTNLQPQRALHAA
ncbi:MAG TPA: hypothetical protein H9898_04165 [Candidatus Anaerobiospirillum stercoravium]|nr:hypothetical protein [Candidatus Anaerobiospirillum stercoravium]